MGIEFDIIKPSKALHRIYHLDSSPQVKNPHICLLVDNQSLMDLASSLFPWSSIGISLKLTGIGLKSKMRVLWRRRIPTKLLEGSPFCRENERVALLDFKASNSNPNATLKVQIDSGKGLNCCTSNGVSLRVDTIPWKDSIEKAPFMSFTKEGKPPIAMNVKNAATNMSMDSVMLNASSLTRLSQLQHLQLRFFAGVLPIKELSKLKNLSELILVSNEFSGGIPEEVGLLSSLKKLDLRNHHQGPIPASIGGLTFLVELDLSYNDLNGRILEEVGLLSSLQKLYLDGNRLQGRIPSTLGNLSRLNVLQLYGNQLSCSIPESLGSLLSLERLDIGENKLEGSIPSTLNNLSRLNVLQLYGNQLSGSILESLGSLLSLESLDPHENKLEGSIPSTLGNLSRLNGLELYGNQLSDSIPESLGSLLSLERLELDKNEL
ncbi:MDIS1-interacting receptor like kinase 2-like [Amborella trichopoda]|nr:MDIS1-interacting receptor like kinase 2-like [Amborella trichopoda]|eukprot:XP_020520738.1 MDIS1-interacting receptor like kinase 2-like [Amborella trichopoda]